MTHLTDKVAELAASIQNDCHDSVDALRTYHKKMTYQDGVNIWLFTVLAHIELRLQKLEDEKL